MKILVAGGAGYIGSVCVEQLVERGHDVVVVDNLSRGHRQAVHPDAWLEIGDLSDVAFLQRVFSATKFDAVMHFCAASLVGESVSDPLPYYGNNLTNGFNLVRTMLDHGVKHFVFSSTAALFGEPRSVPIDESAIKDPTNPYGRTKLFFEGFLNDCDAAYGLKSICLRYFNAAGASEKFGEDHDPETHLIPIILQVAAGQREKVMIFGDDYATPDGTCVRDYIHVLDLAEAHILALDYLRGENISDQFNLGNGKGYSVLEVVAAVESVTDREILIQMAPRRRGDPAVLVAASEKAREILSWNPTRGSLKQIITSAWQWMDNHRAGYQG
ncbi:UDP-glucose 4-epimerase GalE [candidate division BRC1 bacterium HGW-BRC1-1]|nr:MAG: UDP-glucose 4-epimerase GalE [candidate division BRC1 bacterium HGW-BRC1-1]